jgi:hypothetical protein
VEFAQSVQAHLRALAAGDRAVVLGAIERQLSDQPLVETPQAVAAQPDRALAVERRESSRLLRGRPEANGPVRILAVGRKQRSILMIGGEEVRL